ncbi:MAG: hypothetical protein HC890_08560 [Chloroflexaceae bacterium]|nr:hypothetical protein [Chloroflexaceae bacterium]
MSASIICAIAFGFSGWRLAFQSAYVVQDDARQHIFWMQRFLDGELFPQDLIADYFQSVAPAGYSLLYRLAATLGIEPLLFSKLLPAILGVALSLFAFGVCLTLFPLPFAGFLSVLLLNQNLWMVDDLSSGTPRAFFYPLFLGFLYFFLHRKPIYCCLMIFLQGLFYPQSVLLSLATLGLQFLVKLKSDLKHRDYRLILPCMAVAIAILAVYAQSSSEFAPIISVERAKELPEFSATGRAAFWSDNPFRFWLLGRSGLLPHDWPYLIMFSFGAVLPILRSNTHRFPLARHLTPQSSILIQILIASLGCFLLAHLFLFRLHLPVATFITVCESSLL